MKTLVKMMSVAVLTATLAAVGFAQEAPKPDLTTMYTTFREKQKAKCGERDEALALGKQIVQVHGDDPINKDVIDYVKKRIAVIEKEDPRCKLNTAYDKAYNEKNWPTFFSVSKQIMALEGDSPLGIDLLLQHVATGYALTDVSKIDTYNNETISYAKLALQKLAAPTVASQTKKWGVFDVFDTKDNAISWMNRFLGYYADKNGQKREALGYAYKSTLLGIENPKDLKILKTIGDYYFDEANRLFNDYSERRKANNGEETDELKVVLGTARANADRGIDAYARAYKIAAADPTKTNAKTAFLKDTTALYRFRFNKPETDKVPELAAYIDTQVAKPMPDPMTDVTPVIEAPKPEVPATTPTTTTPAKPTTPTTTTPAKPATTTPAKPAATPAKPAATPAKPAATPAKTTSKAPAKTVKKKGTR